jgi:uncharacterized protein YjdB
MLDAQNDYGIVFDQTVTGAVQIVLNGTNKVTGDGIRVPGVTSSLTITGPGILTTEGGYIGILAGNIKISGGTVTAKGSDYGIYAFNNIEINGGTVAAEGGDFGIRAMNNIKITGGAVTTEGDIDGISTDNNIEISGGAVTTEGGNYGIYASNNIEISGGTVTAAGGIGIYADNNIEINGDTIVKASGASVSEAIESFYEGANVSVDKGVVFRNGVGEVYGDVTLPGDLMIASSETLTIPSGATLTIPSGKTLTNNGTITNSGSIFGSGTITGSGTTVVPVIKVTKVTITNSISTYTYKAADAVHTLQHIVSIGPANATVKDVAWQSGDKTIATVNATGLVTFTGKEGTVRITVASADGPSHYKDIKVVRNVTKIRTPLATLYIQKGKSLKIPVALDDNSDLTKAVSSKLAWKSSNTKVLTVDKNGKITAAKKVTKKTKATVTATAANGKALKLTVYVVPKASAHKGHTITGLPKGNKLAVGKTAVLAPKLKNAKATTLTVSYKSSNAKVLSVDNAGKIVAKKKERR